jgi:hypothetical protein
MKHYLMTQLLYSIRWQTSTPMMAIVPILYKRIFKKETLSSKEIFWCIVVANFIGSFIYIWLDFFILHF